MADNSDEDVQEVRKQNNCIGKYRKYGSFWLTTRAVCLQRLKAALWFAVGKMVDEETLRRNRNVTPQYIGALTEMVWSQIGMRF